MTKSLASAHTRSGCGAEPGRVSLGMVCLGGFECCCHITQLAPLALFCLWGSMILLQGLSVRLLDVSGQMVAQNKGMCKRRPVKWGTYHLCSFDTLTWSYQDNFYLLQTWHLVAHCQKEIFNLFLYYLQCMWNLCQDIIDNFYHKIAFLMPIRMKDSYLLQISSTKLLLTWPLWNICVN